MRRLDATVISQQGMDADGDADGDAIAIYGDL